MSTGVPSSRSLAVGSVSWNSCNTLWKEWKLTRLLLAEFTEPQAVDAFLSTAIPLDMSSSSRPSLCA